MEGWGAMDMRKKLKGLTWAGAGCGLRRVAGYGAGIGRHEVL